MAIEWNKTLWDILYIITLNTNIDGKTNVMFALTSIKGIGRRYANIVLKKADIPMTKRAGELGEEDVEKIITIMQVKYVVLIPTL